MKKAQPKSLNEIKKLALDNSMELSAEDFKFYLDHNPNFDLASKQDLALFNAFSEYGTASQELLNNSTIQDYLATNEYAIYYKDIIFLANAVDCNIFALRNGLFYYVLSYDDDTLDNLHKYASNDEPSGVLIQERSKSYVLWNADIQQWENSSLMNINKDFPGISFRCLQRFGLEVNQFNTGRLKIVDRTQDIRIKSKKSERPGLGFTYIKGYWHKPANVLIYDREENRTILFGIDDESYFGCQLKDNPKTIDKAFESLIPKEVKEFQYSKTLQVQRQGEWFAVPVPESVVPAVENCLATSSELILPRKHQKSNMHVISVSDNDNIRISKDGIIYAKNFDLEHIDHPSLDCAGWHTFYENTAVQSFSEEGVD